MAPQEIIDHIKLYNAATGNSALPAASIGSSEFLNDVRSAVAALPDFLKRKLEQRVLGIFVMTGLGSSAITDVIAYPNGDIIGAFITIDLDAFADRRANEWATWKENNPFSGDTDIQLEVIVAEGIDDSRRTAIQYNLLHEFAHIMAAESDLLPNWWKEWSEIDDFDRYRFLRLGWVLDDEGNLCSSSDQKDFPLRRHIKFYEREKLPRRDIPAVYRQLETSTFPTLYASINPHEDFAECFATYIHTVVLGKKWETVVRQNGDVIARIADFWKAERSATKAAFFRALLDEEMPPFSRRAQNAAFAKICFTIIEQSTERFLGLAPFLRLSIGNVDLRQVAETLLAIAQSNQENPYIWMNLATVFFATEQRDLGLAIQMEGLKIQRTYLLPAARQPAKFTLLMLMVPGDLAENTPLDCLLEDSDVDFILYYTTAQNPLPSDVPAHDAVMVAFSDTDDNRWILKALEGLLRHWPKPVFNAPQCIPNAERSMASALLQNVPGLLMPPTHQVTRDLLQSVLDGQLPIHQIFGGCRFPIILRPVGSHAGRDLERIEDSAGISRYLSEVSGTDFYISNFIDYRSADGLYRKYRIAIIAGQPFACHMAISSDWMIHYVNAGMYEDSAKRAEEASFMKNFAEFADRHGSALLEIYKRSELEYLCIDCAEANGDLFIFEIDHAMVIHAMDSEEMFPHKQIHMQKV
jgi:glutathione synthase/RimK-type ligase-like ATP-grasp enzyme